MSAYNSYSDADLLNLFKQDDIDAFTAIHSRYYGVLYSHAYKRLPNREEVKDMLQDLFTSTWDNRASIKSNANLQGYLYTSARNRILNIYKYQKVRSDYASSFAQFLTNDQPTPDETLRLKELIVWINEEIRALPSQMRVVFEMSRNNNLSYQEIAEKLNISPLTVKKQVNNSLKILRLKIGIHFLCYFFNFHLLLRKLSVVLVYISRITHPDRNHATRKNRRSTAEIPFRPGNT